MKQQQCVAALENARVLIIEDDLTLGESLEEILALFDIDAHLVHDGLAGEAMYRQYQEQISLIILDWSLPVQDGVTTLHHIRQLNTDVGVILLSGYEAEKVKKQIPTADFHFVTIVRKPFDIEDFVTEVKRLLAKYVWLQD